MELTVYHQGTGTILGYSGPLAIGVMNHEAGDPEAIEHPIGMIDMLLEHHPAVAFLLVVEHGARTPDGQERRRMQDTFARYGDRLVVGYATCGLGFWVSALRVVLVGISRMVGAPIIAHGSVEATAQHLARELVGLDPEAAITHAEELRARLRDSTLERSSGASA